MYVLHKMYEDSDLDGAHEAEALIDALERMTPGLYVGILANDSVSPPCCNEQGHFHCDYYVPDWYTVLVPAAIWKEYEDAVQAKEQEWKAAHSCRVNQES